MHSSRLTTKRGRSRSTGTSNSKNENQTKRAPTSSNSINRSSIEVKDNTEEEKLMEGVENKTSKVSKSSKTKETVKYEDVIESSSDESERIREIDECDVSSKRIKGLVDKSTDDYVEYIFEFEDMVSESKKKEVAMAPAFINAGEPVRCSLTIHCASVNSYAQFCRLGCGLKKKLFFVYLLKILQKKADQCICTSGLQYMDTIHSIITHFETWRSSQREGNVYIRVHGPEGSVILMIALPLFLVTVKDLILTRQGTYELKPTLEDIIYAERISEIN